MTTTLRLAVLSDIHGNLDALQAVLADLESSGGADHIWVLGDLSAFGPDPGACIQAVKAIPDAKVIHGNTDRYLFTGVRPLMPEPVEDKWESMPKITRLRDAVFSWSLEHIGWEEIDYLMKLPTDLSMEVEGYGWIVGFHAIPGNDEGVLLPDASEHEIRDALLDREGRLAFGGHTHLPADRDTGDWRFVNPGSVGLPYDGDNRASYAVITFEDDVAAVDIRRIAYDVETVIAKLEAGGYPALEMQSRRLREAHP